MKKMIVSVVILSIVSLGWTGFAWAQWEAAHDTVAKAPSCMMRCAK